MISGYVWETLTQEMNQENQTDEVFLQSRIEPEVLKKAYEDGLAVIIFEQEPNSLSKERIIGIGVIWETNDRNWYEFGSLWVATQFRGKGLAHRIYKELIALLPKDAKGFIVTHNPKVVSLALGHGFIEATESSWYSAAPNTIVCQPCDRWQTDEDKKDCPYRAVSTKCRLFTC